MIEVGALHALALAAAGDQATALTTLAGALALAGPDGYVRVFADEGPAMEIGRASCRERVYHPV